MGRNRKSRRREAAGPNGERGNGDNAPKRIPSILTRTEATEKIEPGRSVWAIPACKRDRPWALQTIGSPHLSKKGLAVLKEDDVTQMRDREATPQTIGKIIHWAFWYDLLVWVLWLGREGALRERVVDLARLKPDESVLDVGCGTGTLAITAKRRVGSKGRECGIDASPEMIKRACKKARKEGLDVIFENAVVEKLPFPNATFDSVLSTAMLHHLPDEARRK